MRIRLPALLFIGAAALTSSAHAVDPACRSPQSQTELAAALSQAALFEYRQFPGHRVDAQGRLWKFGAVEAESEALYDPETGKADAKQPDHVAWRRVWRYWETLATHETGSAGEQQMTSLPGLLDDGNVQQGRPRRITAGDLLEQLKQFDAIKAEPLRQAAVRAAITDTPWSAAFISYLMHQAHLTEQQFRFSATHANYIRKAFEQPEGYAYRACDPVSTAPRVGDLICYSRGANPMVGFKGWHDRIEQLGNSVKSHCDLVVSVDKAARKMEVVGGNVLQSVTRRKLSLNADGYLSRSYQAESYKLRKNSECAHDISCQKDNLNVQYWGVLLQLR